MTRRSPLRTAARVAAAAVGLLVPAALAVAWTGARVLTVGPAEPGAQPTWTLHPLDRRLVRVTGSDHDVPGWWGVRLADAYVRLGPAVGPDLRGGTVRPFEVLEGRSPFDRRDRRDGDRRDGDRRSSTTPGGAQDQQATSPGQGASPGQGVAPERRAPDHRRDRRAARRADRRREARPGPWPVRGTRSPYAWPDDPQVLAARTGATLVLDGVRVDGRTLPTWRLVPPEHSDTWVVGVHGRGSSRTELFRIAGAALRAGHPVLVVSYRTDRWTAGPAATTTLGTTEWRDVEAGMAACLAGGAHSVVLAGCSLGGAMVAATARNSELAPWIRGLVLDSPALQWVRVLRHTARMRRLPTVLVRPVMLLARLRSRIDWAALDHLAAADEFTNPILLLHGVEDDVVPVWLSDAFAAARPDLVTYERFPAADHVTSWNVDRERYETSLGRFLDALGP